MTLTISGKASINGTFHAGPVEEIGITSPAYPDLYELWTMDDVTGSMINGSATETTNKPLMLVNGMTTAADTLSGDALTGGLLAGNQRLINTNLPECYSNGISISMWVKGQQYPSNPQQQTIINIISTDDDNLFTIATSTGWNSYVWLWRSSDATIIEEPISPSPVNNVWTHIGLTMSPTSAVAYLEGSPKNIIPVNGMFTTKNVNIAIGNHSRTTLDRAFEGQIDQVRIFSRALSAIEMAELADEFTP